MTQPVSPAEQTNAEPYYPSQPPYQFMDQVLFRSETMLKAIKNISRNEWCLLPTSAGEAGGYPSLLIVESMAQAAGSLDEYVQQRTPPKKTFLSRIKGVELKQLPVPGDSLVITVHLLKVWKNQAAYAAEAFSGDELAVRATFFFVRQ